MRIRWEGVGLILAGIAAFLSTIPTWGLDAEVAVPAGLALTGAGIAELAKHGK